MYGETVPPEVESFSNIGRVLKSDLVPTNRPKIARDQNHDSFHVKVFED